MGRGALRGLEVLIVARYAAFWAMLTRVVLGTGIGVVVVITILLRPWAVLVLIAVALPTRGWLARLSHELLPISARNRRFVGLFIAAATGSVGWGLMSGAPGVAVVALDALAGLPVLLRSTAKPARAIGSGAPTTRLRLTLGREPRSVSRRGREPAGLNGLTLALGEALPAQAGERRLLDQLSDAELRHAWQASCRALLMVDDPAVTQRIVEARGLYLDAMAQRDPKWFSSWALSSLNATQPLQDGSELDR